MTAPSRADAVRRFELGQTMAEDLFARGRTLP